MKGKILSKKFFALLIGIGVLISQPASAATFTKNEPDATATTTLSQSHKKTIKISNPEQFAQSCGIKPPKPNAKLVEIALVVNEETPYTSLISPEWTGKGYYLQNVLNTGNTCGLEVIRDSYYTGPAEATMTVTSQVSAQWSANVGISAEGVSAGVGFQVTEQFSVSDAYKVTVPAGQIYEVQAHPIYSNKSYDVWYDPLIGSAYKAGSGWAAKPVGVCFSQWSI